MNRWRNLALAGLMVLAVALASQADPFGINWPTFKNNTPGELGEPSITFVSRYGATETYYDGKTQAYWWFNNGRWAGYFVEYQTKTPEGIPTVGYICSEIRGNSYYRTYLVAAPGARQLPDGYFQINGEVKDSDGNVLGPWHAIYKP